MEYALLGICDSASSCILHASLFLIPFLFNLAKRSIQQAVQRLAPPVSRDSQPWHPAPQLLSVSSHRQHLTVRKCWLKTEGPVKRSSDSHVPFSTSPTHLQMPETARSAHWAVSPTEPGAMLSHHLPHGQDKSQVEARPQQTVQCLLCYRAEQNR